ncbi:ABC transporter substrate-binding protein [Rhodoplanes roseus]|uniref:Thiamine pyrimidine synthase n=1 Tax=Rhodoplanes roseus TaxID=29409 RepID=A0A327KYL8_9BRAD|nr:ABC transporter substrate-binding protein [Rhodoplanes roseus]RAI43124.1 hypothetical protein CH341_15980 [Rhodoplanes roseus]
MTAWLRTAPTIAILTIATLLGFGSSAFAQKVRLTLDFALQGQQSPFILAVEGGYFSRAGVDVVVERGYGSADAITKVASGAYDMAFADIGAMIQFNGKQHAAKVISVFQIYDIAPMTVLSLAKSGIKTPADLAGKRIAAPPGSSTRVMFPLLATATGLDMSTIKWLDVTPQLRETLLVQGQADATTALVTDLAGLAHLGISEKDLTIMRYGDFGVPLYGHAVLTTPEFAEKNPETVKKVLVAVAQAWRDSIADPGKAIDALKKRNPLAEETVERKRLQDVIDWGIVTERTKRDGLGAVDPARMTETIAMVAKAFSLEPMSAAVTYRPDFLPPAEMRRLPK